MNPSPIHIVNPHVSNDGNVMLPTAWNHATGQVVVCEFKRSGQVMASESYECTEQRMRDGEILKGWRYLPPQAD